MSFYDTYKGKYFKPNSNSSRAAGVCDFSSMVFPHSELKKQMQWTGDQLTWTGLMVAERFLDKPNPQDRPPPINNDPTVIANPRPPQGYQPLAPNTLTYQQIRAKLGQIRQNLPLSPKY